METAIIVLAAGMGKRMDSDLPKVLHEIAGAPLITHVLNTVKNLEPQKIVIVTGHGATEVENKVTQFDPEVTFAKQKIQKGTGHAVNCARSHLKDFKGSTLIVYGDVPFITADTYADILAMKEKNTDMVVLSFNSENPNNYGRLVVDNGELIRIIEAKDANIDELNIKLCNSGVICIDNDLLFDLLNKITNKNASEEYYLSLIHI